MTTNKYFSHNKFANNQNEQDLIHGFTVEAIQQMGFDMKYIRRETVKLDELFGEDVLSEFSEHWDIEMYLEEAEGFNNSDVINMFGINIKDQATLHVARRRFQEVTGMQQPMEGDLIFFPLSETFFEIRFVQDERQFFPLGTLPSFKLTIEFFNYTSEDFNTGDPEIDKIIDSIPSTDSLNGILDDSDAIQTEGETFIEEDNKSKTIWGDY